MTSDGSFGYTPNPGFGGMDSYTYRATDSKAPSNPATVTINVAGVPNMPPVAQDDDVTTDEDTLLNGDVLSDRPMAPTAMRTSTR